MSRRVAAEANRGIGRLRIQQTTERRHRVHEVAERLRTNHECDHRWRRRQVDGRCGDCGNCMKHFLMVRALTGSRIQGRLNFRPRNVENAGTVLSSLRLQPILNARRSISWLPKE
jgi:hypothetical protein